MAKSKLEYTFKVTKRYTGGSTPTQDDTFTVTVIDKDEYAAERKVKSIIKDTCSYGGYYQYGYELLHIEEK